MAQKITVALEDDLDGGPADETVRFGLDGAEYEIDLSTRTPRRSAASSRPSSIMPARLGWGQRRRPGRPASSRERSARHPGLGERPGHRGQRPRAHPASVAEQYDAATKGS